MAKKRRRKRSRLKTLFLFIATPLMVWLIAFVIWFYWTDIVRLARNDSSQASSRTVRKPERAPENKPKEKIFEQDRKKLEDILNKSR